jgi:hypothetical protein
VARPLLLSEVSPLSSTALFVRRGGEREGRGRRKGPHVCQLTRNYSLLELQVPLLEIHIQ